MGAMTRVDRLEGMLRRASLRRGPSAKRVAKKWKSLPKGWTDESRKKFWETLTGDVKHKVAKCIKEMEGKSGIDDPGAFCAALADRVEGKGWRSDRSASGRTSCGDGPCQCGGNCGCGGSPLSMKPDYGTSDAALPRGVQAGSWRQTQEGLWLRHTRNGVYKMAPSGKTWILTFRPKGSQRWEHVGSDKNLSVLRVLSKAHDRGPAVAHP